MIPRVLVAIEAASFALASLIHSGVLMSGYEHRQARVAEGVIAVVLFAGLTSTWGWPAHARSVLFGAQLFALVGTLVGVFTIAIGVGPRSVPDLAYHATILPVLACGLWIVRSTNGRWAR